MNTARTTPGINPAQVKKLHALKTALGLDDAAYRAALAACGRTSDNGAWAQRRWGEEPMAHAHQDRAVEAPQGRHILSPA